MKKRKYLLPFLAGLVLLLISTAIYANSIIPKQQINDEFNQIKQQLDQISQYEELPIVTGENFQIPVKNFVFYKSNLQMTYKLQDKKFTPTDDELINEMIKEELVVQYAKNAGIEATAQEISDVINHERKALYDPNITGESKDIVKEIMDNRIRITGLTVDEFWESDETRKTYEKAILIGKVYDHLIAEGKIKNAGDFDQFKNELLQQAQKSLTIHKDLLE